VDRSSLTEELTVKINRSKRKSVRVATLCPQVILSVPVA
jgi:hypothetical protein